MDTGQLKTISDIQDLLHNRKLSHVYVALTDLSGQLRGKYISKDKMFSALEGGLNMVHNFHAATTGDIVYSIDGFTHGEEQAVGDAPVKILPASCRVIPWEAPSRNLLFLAEHADPKGIQIDSRCVYERVLNKATEMGFRPFHACELEFTLLDETTHSVQEKQYRHLKLVNPTTAYYGVMRQTIHAEFFGEIIDTMAQMNIPIEVAHWEFSPSSCEVVLQYAEGCKAADDAVIYKTFLKALAQRQSRMVSFMAKLHDDEPGQSCHIHISLRDTAGNPVFHDSGAEDSISTTMRYFLGGLQKLMPELVLMLAPYVNSYKRFVPDMGPIGANWGINNRSTAFRALSGKPLSQRIENRVGGSDVNPYIALAATLGAGLWGIEHQMEPSEPVAYNAWQNEDRIPDEQRFPETFHDAISKFRNSRIARELFGKEFVRVYADTRAAHDKDFRSHVTTWEIQRMLEVV